MYWPSPGNDPWYWNNPAENDVRRSYYGVNGIPWGFVDGTTTNLDPEPLTANILTRAELTCPYELDVSANIANEEVTVEVLATGPPTEGNYYLRIAVLENEYTSSENYPNGETYVHSAMLDMVPNSLGTPVDLNFGESMEVTYNFDTDRLLMHPSLDLKIVAFIQNDDTKEVFQAAYFIGEMEVAAQTSAALLETSGTANLTGSVTNDYTASSTLDFEITGEIPAGWNVTANSDDGPVTVNGSAIQINIDAEGTFNFDITVDPQGSDGELELSAIASSATNSNFFETTEFHVRTKDMDILVVDDDAGRDYETYAIDAFDAIGSGLDIAALRIQSGDLNANDLNGIQAVIWNVGVSDNTITEGDIEALSSYLDDGGYLYLNGVDIAYDLADPTSPNYSENTLAFFNDYLHADYVQRNFEERTVNGVPEDEITGDISTMKCFAGSGANNLGLSTGKWPDEINPLGPNSDPIFTFKNTTDNYAAVKAVHSANSKVVFTTFGFETIGKESDRNEFMFNIANWFLSLTDIDDIAGAVPSKFSLHQNYPNPFNPNTTIRYEIPGSSQTTLTSLVVYNQLGQKVKTLISESQGPGSYEINWDGSNDGDRSVSSGIYFYKLNHGEFRSSRKMLLIR